MVLVTDLLESYFQCSSLFQKKKNNNALKIDQNRNFYNKLLCISCAHLAFKFSATSNARLEFSKIWCFIAELRKCYIELKAYCEQTNTECFSVVILVTYESVYYPKKGMAACDLTINFQFNIYQCSRICFFCINIIYSDITTLLISFTAISLQFLFYKSIWTKRKVLSKRAVLSD